MPYLRLKDVSVEFPIYDQRARELRTFLVPSRFRRKVYEWRANRVGGVINREDHLKPRVEALENINLSIETGERVGLIGVNGSGKTTLLRVLAGIYEPVSGTFERQGKSMTLFNIQESISPDATGLEAVRIRGKLLGLRGNEIEVMIEDVADFCELGNYIEMPVRTYSTGMQVRLAFAIATFASADILLMDEIIGAGDAAFFEKARARLRSFIDRSAILVIASHNYQIIRDWCTKAVLLHQGDIRRVGKVDDILKDYSEIVASLA